MKTVRHKVINYIDELIDIRADARKNKDWVLSDELRDYLDTKFIFIFDEVDGQVVYHRTSGTRQDIINEIKRDRLANNIFEGWLFSVRASTY